MANQSFLKYALAIVTTVTALVLMLALDPWIHLTQASFLLFFGAVALTALYGGRNPGIVATLLSAIFARYFFLSPQYGWAVDLASSTRMLLFIIQGLLISVLVGALRKAQEQAQKSLNQLQASELEIKQLNQELQHQVDELTLAERTLKSSEERLRVALKNAPISVFNQDQNLRYTWIYNPAFNFQVNQVIGKYDRDLVSPEDAIVLDRIKGDVLATGIGVREEVKLVVNEKPYYYDLTVEPLKDDQGMVTGVTCAAIDITDRKQVETEREQLLARERTARTEAEAANRVKDEFLAVLSHELRSPLNPILGWSKLLQTKKLDETKVAEALKTIERNARLQAELIEDLLDVSRILRGKLSLNLSAVDLNITIQAAIETVRLSAEAKSIQIETQLEPNIAPVMGDASRLQQIVWNLLSNAIKFTPNGGRVEVGLSFVTGHGSVEGETGDRRQKTEDPGLMTNYAQITVTDTGKGISSDFLPYVFEYFRQADSSTTRQFGGLGLGLAIVRHLVELHGGTVQVASEGEGQGATFTIQLPLMVTVSPIEQDSISSKHSPSLEGIKVLVVDDDVDARELFAFLLEQERATVVMVASADEALTTLAQFKPDIILSDIGMPDLDGYTFMQKVRSLPPEAGGQIPAIALTAYAGEYDQRQALKVGFNQHLPKPVDPEILVKIISELIVRSQQK